MTEDPRFAEWRRQEWSCAEDEDDRQLRVLQAIRELTRLGVTADDLVVRYRHPDDAPEPVKSALREYIAASNQAEGWRTLSEVRDAPYACRACHAPIGAYPCGACGYAPPSSAWQALPRD